MSYVNRRVAKRMSDPAFAQVWKESELEYNISHNIIKKCVERGWPQSSETYGDNTKCRITY